MYDFALATCSYGKTDDGTIDCVEEAHEKSGLHFRWRRLSGDGLIGRGRSVMAYRFGWLWNDTDYMIFLDGDIVFQPDDLVKLVEAMRAGYHVVGGLYPIGHGKRLAHAGIDGKINIDGGIQEVRWLSTGFMGISKEILHYLVDELKLPFLHKNFPEFTCYPFFESGARDFEGGIYISEDWDFCEKVKSIGEKVYVHTGVKLGHIKTRIVTASEAIQATAAYKQGGDIWTDLSLFLGKPVSDILSGGAATQLLAKEWDKKESVESFYRNNELYLSDLTQFNSRPDYQDRLAPLKEVRGKKVLDFGCGIGTAVFDLAERNTEVVGCDINKAVLDFAEFRRRKLGFLNARFTDELPDLADFDVVIAIDTLEHIEDLHSLILKFGREMKPGAKLYHVDVFGMREQWPMHFEHGDKIDEWLREAGFIIWNPFWALKV